MKEWRKIRNKILKGVIMFGNSKIKDLERKIYELQKEMVELRDHVVYCENFSSGRGTIVTNSYINPDNNTEGFMVTKAVDSDKYYIDDVLNELLKKSGYVFIPIERQPAKPATFKLEKNKGKK
jgi:hypothetical protein